MEIQKTTLSYLQSQNDQFVLKKKSLHPETLNLQTINDTWVFLALYLTVWLPINLRAQILQVCELEHVENIKTSLLRKC